MSQDEVIVAPSILAADPLRFEEELRSVEAAGAGWHHVDVMDGHFVPNLTFGLPLIERLKERMSIPLDVHIMIANPDQVALDYVSAGADILTFHVEASRHPHRLLQAIKGAGARAGVSINPGTPLEVLTPLLEECQVINMMSVNPGFGGQKFIRSALNRIATVRRWLVEQNLEKQVQIEVDGGVNAETGPLVHKAGAEILVAGSYVYQASNRAEAIACLKNLNR